eukprot:177625-Karenia_brevis.AAC.1
MAQIMLEIKKYENGVKVVGHEANQEAPTRGTAVSPVLRQLRPPQSANKTNMGQAGTSSKANTKTKLKR